MKMNCLHKTGTSFFNCHFFGDFKYDYDNNYANNITIMIMILIFECNHDFPTFHLQTLLLHCKGCRLLKVLFRVRESLSGLQRHLVYNIKKHGTLGVLYVFWITYRVCR